MRSTVKKRWLLFPVSSNWLEITDGTWVKMGFSLYELKSIKCKWFFKKIFLQYMLVNDLKGLYKDYLGEGSDGLGGFFGESRGGL